MVKKIYNHIKNDSLYRNSVFLIINNVTLAFFGFVFWTINTRLFTTKEVGFATTLISAGGLITVFALLGLNVSLVRYLPTSNRKNDKINSSFALITIASFAASLVFIVGIKYFSPKLAFVRENLFIATTFFLFVIFTSLGESLKNVFRAFRQTEYVLVKNTIFNFLRLILVLFFVNLGAFGIFFSWTLSLLIAFLASFVILIRKFSFKFKPVIKIDVVKEMSIFSLANYISEFFERAPRLVLPIMITNLVGAEKTAYFYIDITIAAFLFMVPEAISNSFFAEGSANEKHLRTNIYKVVKAFAVILLPSILVIFFFGDYILLVFGKDYSEQGFMLLKIFAASGFFVAINSIFGNIVRIKHKMKDLVIINLLGAAVILVVSYFFLPISILSVGWAWLAGQLVMNLAYFFTIFKYKSS